MTEGSACYPEGRRRSNGLPGALECSNCFGPVPQQDWTDADGRLTFASVPAARPLQPFVFCGDAFEHHCFLQDRVLDPLTPNAHAQARLTLQIPESSAELDEAMDALALEQPDRDRDAQHDEDDAIRALADRDDLDERTRGLVERMVAKIEGRRPSALADEVQALREAVGLD